MTTPTETPLISDEEIRDWAKSTGKGDQAGARGRVSNKLRSEYEAHVASVRGDQPAAPAAESEPKRPSAARKERTPKPVRTAGSGGFGRLRDWFNGATTDAKGKTTPKSKPDRPRVPLTRLVAKGWDRMSEVAEHVNVPVARTMQWQAPYVGLVADDVISGTPLDKPLQFIAKAEGALTGVGSMIAMPIIVGLITSERNNPEVGGLAAVARQQALHIALQECIDAQLEMFGNSDFVARLAKSSDQREKRAGDVAKIMEMLFAPLPDPVVVQEGATPEQMQEARDKAAANAEHERQIREAVSAVKFMPVPTEPDNRGQAAELAAASMAASAQRAVDGQFLFNTAAGLGDLAPTIEG